MTGYKSPFGEPPEQPIHPRTPMDALELLVSVSEESETVAVAAEYLYHANELELSSVEMNKAWQSLREALMAWRSGEIQASRDYFNALAEAAKKNGQV